MAAAHGSFSRICHGANVHSRLIDGSWPTQVCPPNSSSVRDNEVLFDRLFKVVSVLLLVAGTVPSVL